MKLRCKKLSTRNLLNGLILLPFHTLKTGRNGVKACVINILNLILSIQHPWRRAGMKLLFLLSPAFMLAQRVVYSPLVGNPSATRFEVIGKAGDFYWVQKSKKKNGRKRPVEAWMNDRNISFEIYDARMNLANVIPSVLPDTIIKEYFIGGGKYFDQLIFSKGNNTTTAFLNRYTPGGDVIYSRDTLYNFPVNMKGEDFLLVRSQDKSRILLLGFEPVRDSPPRLHTILYDKDWKPICSAVYKDRNINRPYVQYDFINYPLEHFNNSPVKLANTGEWLMLSPSGNSNNYLVMHFYGNYKGFENKEIVLPDNTGIGEMTLSLNNEKKEAMAGLLLNTRFPSVKRIVAAQYLLSECRVNFDTSYQLNTLAGNKTKNENLFEEYFMSVPGKGFILLKEYGRPALSAYDEDENKKADYIKAGESNVISNPVRLPLNKDDYTRYNDLAGTRSNYDRGDLSLYYFPATRKDSSWSGILNKQQLSELNSSYLSYIFMPVQNKLIFLYNSLLNYDNKRSSTTILDQQGNTLNEGLVFWKANNNLLFQKARQITANELAIPYEKNMWNGFAIIRL